jgi:hypothetical protein
MATKLGLYELLGPFFLAGFTLPKEADDILAILGIDELDMTYDDGAVVFFGTASFGGQGARCRNSNTRSLRARCSPRMTTKCPSA